MKITKSQLKQIIKEELEVVLTDPEAKELFGDHVFEGGEGGHYLGSGQPESTNPHSDFYEMSPIRRGYDDLIDDSGLQTKMVELALSIIDEYKGRPGFNISSARKTILEEIAVMIDLDVMLPEEFPEEETGPGFELGLPRDDPMGDSPGALRMRAKAAKTRGRGGGA